MKILLHICCAPCEIYPAEEIKKKGYLAAGFFYNPNIHPYSEYLKRKREVEEYSNEIGIGVAYAAYELEKYFQHVTYNEAPANRCPACWWMRIKKTAEFAKKNAFDAFTTTLLGSPYQDHGIVKGMCEDISKQAGIKFYYEDFTKGFKEAHYRAKSKGIYCQNYCGCVFSEKERIEKKSQVTRS